MRLLTRGTSELLCSMRFRERGGEQSPQASDAEALLVAANPTSPTRSKIQTKLLSTLSTREADPAETLRRQEEKQVRMSCLAFGAARGVVTPAPATVLPRRVLNTLAFVAMQEKAKTNRDRLVAAKKTRQQSTWERITTTAATKRNTLLSKQETYVARLDSATQVCMLPQNTALSKRTIEFWLTYMSSRSVMRMPDSQRHVDRLQEIQDRAAAEYRRVREVSFIHRILSVELFPCIYRACMTIAQRASREGGPN